MVDWPLTLPLSSYLLTWLDLTVDLQSSLKKSEWETKPEGYRDPANSAKIAPPRALHKIEQAIESAVWQTKANEKDKKDSKDWRWKTPNDETSRYETRSINHDRKPFLGYGSMSTLWALYEHGRRSTGMLL